MAKINLFRRRRQIAVFGVLLTLLVILLQISPAQYQAYWQDWQRFFGYDLGLAEFQADQDALALLEQLEVKGRAPKNGYSREQFSDGWAKIDGCDMRNLILQRDLTEVKIDQKCQVVSGKLQDKYTGREIDFQRGKETSAAVQIEHIVAVSDAWQKGAQQLSAEERYRFYNDPENLMAADGVANQEKGDADAATWLPPNKSFRCEYVAIQVRIKYKYKLWVTQAEKEAMLRELNKCST